MKQFVELPQYQSQLLAAFCAAQGLESNVVIQRALDMFLGEAPHQLVTPDASNHITLPANVTPQITTDTVFGIWQDHDAIGDAVDYQQRLRAEWDNRDSGF